jgi:uncharacterized protein (TIGR02145 family)
MHIKISLLTGIMLLFIIVAVSCTKKPVGPENTNGTAMTDIDGNVYQTIQFGNQIWTVENLRTTRYSDGTPISLDTSATVWNAAAGKYCFYNNTTNADSIRRFGALYDWYAVNARKLAPLGWHIPDTTEWNILENYLIANGYNWDGTISGNAIARSMAAKTDWASYPDTGTVGNDLSKNNRSGFSGLPAGCRNHGFFTEITFHGYWWSATQFDSAAAYYRYLGYDYDRLLRLNFSKSTGFSVRLIKD